MITAIAFAIKAVNNIKNEIFSSNLKYSSDICDVYSFLPTLLI